MKRLAALSFAVAALCPAVVTAQSSTQVSLGALTIDPAPFGQSDLLGRELGFGLSQKIQDAQGSGPWIAGGLTGTQVSPSGYLSSDVLTRNAVAGYGFGETGLSAFLGYGQAEATLSDGDHKARIRSYFLGLSYSREAAGFTWSGAGYVGRSHNVISSDETLTGDADHDGRLLGLSLRTHGMLSGDATRGIDLLVQADALQHTTRDYRLTGPGLGSVSERRSLATALRMEVGAPMQIKGHDLRPYAALTAFGGNADDVRFAAAGASTNFSAPDYLSQTRLSLGTTITANRLRGRLEASTDADGNTGFGTSLGWRY